MTRDDSDRSNIILGASITTAVIIFLIVCIIVCACLCDYVKKTNTSQHSTSQHSTSQQGHSQISEGKIKAIVFVAED